MKPRQSPFGLFGYNGKWASVNKFQLQILNPSCCYPIYLKAESLVAWAGLISFVCNYEFYSGLLLLFSDDFVGKLQL